MPMGVLHEGVMSSLLWQVLNQESDMIGIVV